MALTRAERLLIKLGITQPDEIDLEAIAFSRRGAYPLLCPG